MPLVSVLHLDCNIASSGKALSIAWTPGFFFQHLCSDIGKAHSFFWPAFAFVRFPNESFQPGVAFACSQLKAVLRSQPNAEPTP